MNARPSLPASHLADSSVLPRGGHLWTTAEVARAFGVGVSSVKRWTDEGELEAVKTPGKHRRYTLAALYRFASLQALPTDRLPAIPDAQVRERLVQPRASVTLFDALRRGDDEAVRRLVTPGVSDLSKRAAFLDRVIGDAMREIGDQWACGRLTVDEEHRATYMVTEAVNRLRAAAAAESRPSVLLACPPGELHDAPLHLVRLVFEWRGWRTDYAGANVPWDALRHAVETRRPRLVALSAREGEPFRFTDFGKFVAFARARGTRVIVGGEWCRGGTGQEDGFTRFRTLRGLVRWLRSESSQS
jgi:excisionase family DNA binding protein